jgi:hypothetical protein
LYPVDLETFNISIRSFFAIQLGIEFFFSPFFVERTRNKENVEARITDCFARVHFLLRTSSSYLEERWVLMETNASKDWIRSNRLHSVSHYAEIGKERKLGTIKFSNILLLSFLPLLWLTQMLSNIFYRWNWRL